MPPINDEGATGAFRLSLRALFSGSRTLVSAFSTVAIVREIVGCETLNRWVRASWMILCR